MRLKTSLTSSMLLVSLAAPGCKDDGLVDLARAADSATANRMIVHLPGFDAVAEEEKEGGKTYFQLRVPKEKHFKALTQLHELGLLPRARLDLVELLPKSVLDRLSVDAEAAGIEFVRAFAAEDALLLISWVRDARVLISPYTADDASDDASARRAAVVVVHDGTEDDETIRAVSRQVVAGAVEWIDAEGEGVFVQTNLERSPPPAPDWPGETEDVAAAAMPPVAEPAGSDHSSGLMRTVLVGVAALVLLGLTLGLMRGRKRAARRRAAPVESAIAPMS